MRIATAPSHGCTSPTAWLIVIIATLVVSAGGAAAGEAVSRLPSVHAQLLLQPAPLDIITTLAYAQDGRSLLVAGPEAGSTGGDRARLLDPVSGRCLIGLSAPVPQSRLVAATPDLASLLWTHSTGCDVSGADGSLRWHLKTGGPSADGAYGSLSITAGVGALAPDGGRAACAGMVEIMASHRNVPHLLVADRGAVLLRQQVDEPILALAFAGPDRLLVALGHATGPSPSCELRCLDLPGGHTVWSQKVAPAGGDKPWMPAEGATSGILLRVAPDSRRVAVTLGGGKDITVLATADGGQEPALSDERWSGAAIRRLAWVDSAQLLVGTMPDRLPLQGLRGRITQAEAVDRMSGHLWIAEAGGVRRIARLGQECPAVAAWAAGDRLVLGDSELHELRLSDGQPIRPLQPGVTASAEAPDTGPRTGTFARPGGMPGMPPMMMQRFAAAAVSTTAIHPEGRWILRRDPSVVVMWDLQQARATTASALSRPPGAPPGMPAAQMLAGQTEILAGPDGTPILRSAAGCWRFDTAHAVLERIDAPPAGSRICIGSRLLGAAARSRVANEAPVAGRAGGTGIEATIFGEGPPDQGGRRRAPADQDILVVRVAGRDDAVLRVRGTESFPTAVACAPDGSQVIMGSSDGSLRWWRGPDWTLAGSTALDGGARSLAWAGAGFAATSSRGTLALIDGDGGVRTLPGQRLGWRVVGCLPDATLVLSGPDGAIRLQRPDGRPGLDLVDDGAGRWLIASDEGWWDGSPTCTSLIGLRVGDAIAGAELLAPWTNRPDQLLLALASTDAALAERFAHRAGQRMLRLGCTAVPPDPAALPTCRITASTVDAGVARLAIEASTAARTLQILANGVPMAAGRGLALERNQIRMEVSVPLMAGLNRIEASCLDAGGREGPRVGITVPGPASTPSDLHILAIGVSRYRDRRLELACAAKDAADFAAAWQPYVGSTFRSIHTTMLGDEQATVEAIRSAGAALARASVDDICMLFIAGHGAHDDQGTYWFLPHGADPADLSGTCIAFSEIEGLLRLCGGRRRFAFIDTCESGELAPQAIAPAMLARATARGLACRGLRPLDARPAGATAAAPADAYTRTDGERDRFIFADLLVRSGAVVFSASRGDQSSYESASLGNGLFTAALLETLREGDDARQRRGAPLRWGELQRAVTNRVSELTDGLQTPCVDRDNRFCDLALRRGTQRVQRGAPPSPVDAEALRRLAEAPEPGAIIAAVARMDVARAHAAIATAAAATDAAAERSRLLRHAAEVADGMQRPWEGALLAANGATRATLVTAEGMRLDGDYDAVRLTLEIKDRTGSLTIAIDPGQILSAGRVTVTTTPPTP